MAGLKFFMSLSGRLSQCGIREAHFLYHPARLHQVEDEHTEQVG